MREPTDIPNDPRTPEEKTEAALKILSNQAAIDGYYNALVKACEEEENLPIITKEDLDKYIDSNTKLKGLHSFINAVYDLDPKVLRIATDIEAPILEEPYNWEFKIVRGPYTRPNGKPGNLLPKFLPKHVHEAYEAMNNDYLEWLAKQPRDSLPLRPGLLPKSAYRSPAYQSVLALRTIHENGLDETLKSLLPPGWSQHGRINECAVDFLLMGDDVGETTRPDGTPIEIDETIEGAWLLEYAEDYGFWLPFYPDPDNPTSPTGKTGIIIEPWHFQFVGKPRASELMAQHKVKEIFAARHASLGVKPPAIAA